jgi:hypothetical protein
MEDTFIAEDALGKNESVSLFAIFDGHGGKIDYSQGLMLLFLQLGIFVNNFRNTQILKNISISSVSMTPFSKWIR